MFKNIKVCSKNKQNIGELFKTLKIAPLKKIPSNKTSAHINYFHEVENRLNTQFMRSGKPPGSQQKKTTFFF